MYANEITVDVAVIGAGPGGYAAAFRAADLGKKVALIEVGATLGGVCLNVGCIPSKTLLHAAQIINEARQFAAHGIEFGTPKIDIDKLRDFKNGVIKKLTTGLSGLARRRKVEVVNGYGKFISGNKIEVENNANEKILVHFTNAIIAGGSSPVKLPFIPDDPRVIDSTGALELKFVPKRMLVIGGGIIGLEMATVYNSLGSEIVVVEMMDQLIPGTDKDIVKPLQQMLSKKCQSIMLQTKVVSCEAKADGLYVTFASETAPKEPQLFDAILVSVGRTPNGKLIDANKAGVDVDGSGFITVNSRMQTNVPHIYAIGDIIGNPMLAHKAAYEGRLASEIIAGGDRQFTAKCIPGVAYTDPEVATVGITEAEAQKQGINYGKGVFPWIACGRSQSIGRQEGMTKLIFNKDTHKIIGAGIVGPNAGELIAELALAIENELDAEQIALTIHPHPTLSETVMLAAEVFEGTVTDL